MWWEHFLHSEVGNLRKEGSGNTPKATQLGSQEAGVHAQPGAPCQPPTALVNTNLSQQEEGLSLAAGGLTASQNWLLSAEILCKPEGGWSVLRTCTLN